MRNEIRASVKTYVLFIMTNKSQQCDLLDQNNKALYSCTMNTLIQINLRWSATRGRPVHTVNCFNTFRLKTTSTVDAMMGHLAWNGCLYHKQSKRPGYVHCNGCRGWWWMFCGVWTQLSGLCSRWTLTWWKSTEVTDHDLQKTAADAANMQSETGIIITRHRVDSHPKNETFSKGCTSQSPSPLMKPATLRLLKWPTV